MSVEDADAGVEAGADADVLRLVRNDVNVVRPDVDVARPRRGAVASMLPSSSSSPSSPPSSSMVLDAAVLDADGVLAVEVEVLGVLRRAV
jgi:hypothetical protein